VLGQAENSEYTYSVTSGHNTLEISLDGIEPGTYIYRLTSIRGTTQGIVSVIK